MVTERLPIEAKRPSLATRHEERGDVGRPSPARFGPARFGRRLLGTALLVGSIGLASCHGFVLAIFG